MVRIEKGITPARTVDPVKPKAPMQINARCDLSERRLRRELLLPVKD